MYKILRAEHAPKIIKADRAGRATTQQSSTTDKEQPTRNEPKQDFADIEHVAATGDDHEEFIDTSPVDSTNPDYVALIDCLQLLGVNAVEANRFATRMTRRTPSTFLELYGRGRLNELANGRRRNLNCEGLGALDLRTRRPDGEPWDFRLKQHREDALAMVMMVKPKWVIGSPPCTAWCTWNWHLNYKRMTSQKVQEMIKEGKEHLTFMLEIYRIQKEAGR